jgi:hypothetical protein
MIIVLLSFVASEQMPTFRRLAATKIAKIQLERHIRIEGIAVADQYISHIASRVGIKDRTVKSSLLGSCSTSRELMRNLRVT